MFAAVQPRESHVTAPAGAAAVEDCAPSADDREVAAAIIAAFELVLSTATDRGYEATFLNTQIIDVEDRARRSANGTPGGIASPVAKIVLEWLEERRSALEQRINDSLRLARAL